MTQPNPFCVDDCWWFQPIPNIWKSTRIIIPGRKNNHLSNHQPRLQYVTTPLDKLLWWLYLATFYGVTCRKLVDTQFQFLVLENDLNHSIWSKMIKRLCGVALVIPCFPESGRGGAELLLCTRPSSPRRSSAAAAPKTGSPVAAASSATKVGSAMRRHLTVMARSTYFWCTEMYSSVKYHINHNHNQFHTHSA